MRRALAIALPLLTAVGTAASAQDHSGHAGHVAPAKGASPASSEMPAAAPVPDTPADHAADAWYDPAAMAEARGMLRHEMGGMPHSMLLIDRLEWRPGPGADGYAWEVEGWIGGDIDKLALKSTGEGAFGTAPGRAGVQVGWLRAVDPWFNIRVGVRQDFQPGPRRTHAVLAMEGVAPYWIDVEGELFLSQKGELTARAEASYDQRITQRIVLQPRMEVNLSAENMPALKTGSGVTSVGAGLRLRYEIVREFAPYVGVNWERELGRTGRYSRAAGEDPDTLRFVTGIRFWF